MATEDIRLFTATPDKICCGSDEVDKIYVGTNLVWEPDSGGGGETILDVFTTTSGTWRSGNTWWNTYHTGGSWSSTGTTTGTYLAIDSGSRIDNQFCMFSALDPISQPDGPSLPAGTRLRVEFTPSTGGPNFAVQGTPVGAGDNRFYWDDGNGNAVVLADADFEDGGNWGWDAADTKTFTLFIP